MVASIRLFMGLIAFTTITFIAILFLMSSPGKKASKTHTTSKFILMDILDDKKPTEGTKIFFHETSFFLSQSNKSINPPVRQACAVESAARMNPDSTVFLLFTMPNRTDVGLSLNTSNTAVKELLKIPNIRIRTLDVRKYTNDTPLKSFIKSGKLLKSKYPVVHTSDVLRFLSFGGTYMDLDMVIMKDLNKLGTNFVAVESNVSLGNSILNFGAKEIGHEVADGCIKEIRDNYNGKKWAFNGPGAITRVLKKYCNTENVLDMNSQSCQGFHILPSTVFYPIHFKNWTMYFDAELTDLVLKTVESSYGIHLWNKLSVNTLVHKNEPDVAYGYLARKHCPNVFHKSGDTF